MYRDLRSGLERADHLHGRPVLLVWVALLDLVMGRSPHLHLPAGLDLPGLRSGLRTFGVRVEVVRSRSGRSETRLHPPVWASWL